VLDVSLHRAEGGSRSLPVVVSNVTSSGGELSIGVKFPRLKLRHYQVVADLMYSSAVDLNAFREGRRKPQGILLGVYTFIRWGVTEPFRGARFFVAHIRDRRAEAARAIAAASAPAFSLASEAAAPSGVSVESLPVALAARQ
jgi:cellulose synthase (UDP-forming)